MTKTITTENGLGPIHQAIFSLPRKHKQALMLLGDIVMLPLALWSAYALRLSELYPLEYLEPAVILFGFLIVGGAPILVKLGLYRAVNRYLSSSTILSVVQGIFVMTVGLYLLSWLFQVHHFRSVPRIFFGCDYLRWRD